MKNNEIFLQELRTEYELNIAEVMYQYASKLLDQVEDDDILDLYAENDCFGKISRMNKEEILKNEDLLEETILVLEQHIATRNDDEDKAKFEEMCSFLENLNLDELTRLIEYFSKR